MPIYVYKAVDKKGNECEGNIEAASYKDAFMRIKTQEMYPTEIYQSAEHDQSDAGVSMPANIMRMFRRKVKTKQLVPFISDFAILIESGVSLVRALSVLDKQAISKHLKNVVLDLRSDVEGGQTFSDALSKHPEVFSKLFINMVRAGELGGFMGETLDRLAVLYEKNARLESKIRAALTYPAVVLLFALVVVVFIVGAMVPKFFTIFNDLEAELPFLTQMLYNISNFVRDWWFSTLCGIFFIGIVFRSLLQVKAVQYVRDAFIIKMPVFGPLFTKVSISRFCRTFGTLLASGVPILQTLSIAKDATGNLIYAQAIEKVKESIKEGESIAEPLSQFNLFPPLVTNMIMVGEETGALKTMLIKIADRYDDEVDTVVVQLSSLIEPFLLLGLGIIVGIIVAALFLPLISIVTNLANV